MNMLSNAAWWEGPIVALIDGSNSKDSWNARVPLLIDHKGRVTLACMMDNLA
jgi:hypothetical protein